MMKTLLFCFALVLISQFSSSQRSVKNQDIYQCLPCGRDCDKAGYAIPGKCASCGMELVKKTSVVFRTIQPNAVCAYLQTHPGIVLLDVRTPDEFSGRANPDFGTLKNAINIPVQELRARVGELAKLKNRPIIVYCSHSHRSPEASYVLTQNGFKHVTNMAGGMSVMSRSNPCRK